MQLHELNTSTNYTSDVELAPAFGDPNGVDWEDWRRYQQEHVQIFHIIATRTMHARAWGTGIGTATRR
jgi:hypothetical protein